MERRKSPRAAASPTPGTEITLDEASLLNYLARLPREDRIQEKALVHSRLSKESFAFAVASVLMDPATHVPEHARKHAAWLEEDCRKQAPLEPDAIAPVPRVPARREKQLR